MLSYGFYYSNFCNNFPSNRKYACKKLTTVSRAVYNLFLHLFFMKLYYEMALSGNTSYRNGNKTFNARCNRSSYSLLRYKQNLIRTSTFKSDSNVLLVKNSNFLLVRHRTCRSFPLKNSCSPSITSV